MSAGKYNKIVMTITNMLQNLIHVYTFRPFTDKKMENWVKRVWKNKNKHIHNCMVYAGNVSFQTAKKSLLYRYPVYYGHPVFGMFDMHHFASMFPHNKMSGKHRHLTTLIKKIMNVDSSHRYVWGGPVDVCTEKMKSIRTGRKQTTFVLHTWGVNLESTQTSDYKQFMREGGHLRRELYASVTLNMLENIAKAVGIVMNRFIGGRKKHDAKVHVVIPQIGTCAFLSAVRDHSDHTFASMFLYNAITHTPEQKKVHSNDIDFSRSVQRTLNNISRLFEKNNMHVHYCVYDGKLVNHHQNVVSTVSKRVTVHYGNGNHSFGKNEGDIFYVLRKLNSANNLILVNAWDPKSFVGNGMSEDPTIDGFIVSGTKNGSYWRNTSFLHNPILHVCA